MPVFLYNLLMKSFAIILISSDLQVFHSALGAPKHLSSPQRSRSLIMEPSTPLHGAKEHGHIPFLSYPLPELATHGFADLSRPIIQTQMESSFIPNKERSRTVLVVWRDLGATFTSLGRAHVERRPLYVRIKV